MDSSRKPELPFLSGHLAELIRLRHRNVEVASEFVRYSAPVPFFGRISHSRIASVGINPSVREFADQQNNELHPSLRRIETLGTLGLRSWLDADHSHLRKVVTACENYFQNRPYDQWFGTLEKLIAPCGVSYYSREHSACHLDIIPFATRESWGSLSSRYRGKAMNAFAAAFACVLKRTRARVLIANGATVVRALQRIVGNGLASETMSDWSLSRTNQKSVAGIAYETRVTQMAGVQFQSPILVLGFNHNLQSSYGVTNQVIAAIGHWISTRVGKFEQ